MQLVNEFRVPVPVEAAWDVLTDVARIAPCLPGAQLISVDGDEFSGAVKVKVGPITVAYKGDAVFMEKDVSARRAVIKANGKEVRGQGNAFAVVTAELSDDGSATSCVLTTELTVSGKAAQFGRGVLADVAGKLIGQFADRLAADVLSSSTSGSSGSSGLASGSSGSSGSSGLASGSSGSASAAVQPPADSVDLLGIVAVPVAKRALPVMAGLLVGVVIGFVVGRQS